MIRYDEPTKLLWIDAETVVDAQSLYVKHIDLLEVNGIRALVLRGSNRVIHLINNPEEIAEFIAPIQAPERASPTLSAMLEQEIDGESIHVELAILCEATEQICLSWKDSALLSLWKAEGEFGEADDKIALRLFEETIPNAIPASLSLLWATEFEGAKTHFYLACVDREHEVEDGLWLSPSLLNGWKLDRRLVAAFANSPRLSKLIRRNPA